MIEEDNKNKAIQTTKSIALYLVTSCPKLDKAKL